MASPQEPNASTNVPRHGRIHVLPDDTVCACLHETGGRQVRLYERCQRCGAFMDADCVTEEIQELEARVAALTQALEDIGICANGVVNAGPFPSDTERLEEVRLALIRARAALRVGQEGER